MAGASEGRYPRVLLPKRWHMPTSQEQFERICKVLADPQRFAILEVVCRAGGEVACRDIVPRFPVSQATISHHLKELMAVGLVAGRREGQCLMLSPRPLAVEAYLQHLRRRLVPGDRG